MPPASFLTSSHRICAAARAQSAGLAARVRAGCRDRWPRTIICTRAQELLEWKPRIEQIQQHAATTFVFANNDVGGKSVVNALQLAQMLGDERRMAPADLIAAFPNELAEFHSDRPMQDALFSSYEPEHRAVA